MTKRVHTNAFRRKAVQEVFSGGTLRGVAKKRDIHPSLLSKWCKKYHVPRKPPASAPESVRVVEMTISHKGARGRILKIEGEVSARDVGVLLAIIGGDEALP